MHADARKAAEDFIETVIAPRRQARKPDAKSRDARAKLAREEMELARSELKASGIDAERLDKIAAERAKKRRKLAEGDRQHAIEESADAARRIEDLRPMVWPLAPVETIIDQMLFIRSFANQGYVLESNIAPSDNWARYRLENTDDWNGTGRLSFFALWQNDRSTSTIIMARANLSINAHVSCDAEWNGVASWFGFDSEGSAKVRLQTTVWGMDTSVSSIVQQRDVAEVSASGGFFGDDSSESIEFNELLPASGVVVPARAYSLIEVEVLTDWVARSGSATLDAESGSHRVSLPSIILGEVRTEEPPPQWPIALSASVSYATSPATVTLTWFGASTSLVDIYQDNVRRANTNNDGTTSIQIASGTYVFRICEPGSTAVCSNEVTVTVTQ